MQPFLYTTIFDISLPLHEDTIVYPNNPTIQCTENKSATSKHTEIVMGSHTGTHIDAPSHVFLENGDPIGSYPLDAMLGPARVLDVSDVVESIHIRDLEPFNIQSGERILLKTKNSLRGYETFYDDYIYLDGDTAEWLAKKEVALIGVDYLSIKKRGGSDNRPHTALLSKKIPIYEGLRLTDVEAGEYFFIGLPLRFDDLDGSPTRAVLLR